MLDIKEYMKKTRDERQSHIDLKSECIEIGGHSREYRGLLAHYLKTTIPKGHKYLLCHACNNGGCSNVKHLYWGTFSDNQRDRAKVSNTVYENMLKKHGKEKTAKMMSENGRLGGKAARHKRLSDSEIQRRKEILKDINFSEYGELSRAARLLGISCTHTRRFINKYMGS
jgi:hypothetical protein